MADDLKWLDTISELALKHRSRYPQCSAYFSQIEGAVDSIRRRLKGQSSEAEDKSLEYKSHSALLDPLKLQPISKKPGEDA